jgi:hypothetical protein
LNIFCQAVNSADSNLIILVSTSISASSASSFSITSATFFSGTGFADFQCAALEILTIKTGKRGLALGLIRHFDKTKSARFATEFVLDNCRTRDLAESFERLPQIIVGRVMR